MEKNPINELEQFELQNKRKYSQKRKYACTHCNKSFSGRRIAFHESRCLMKTLPDGCFVNLKAKDKRNASYVCSCGYENRYSRFLKHVYECQKKKKNEESTITPSIAELKSYQEEGILLHDFTENEIAPVIINHPQSIVKTEKELEKEEEELDDYDSGWSLSYESPPAKVIPPLEKENDINNQNILPHFDSRTHTKFSQFKLPHEDAPFTTLSNRHRIFSMSLLLRFTGYFEYGINSWTECRCSSISTRRFMDQLNSHASIFKNNPRTLGEVSDDLQDIALVDEELLTVVNWELLIHRLKEALENHQYAAIWYVAHTAPLIERQRKRAPRAHWETKKMRKYIADVRYRNKKWGVKLKPMTILKMRERACYSEEMDQMYLLKYHMARPIPKNHRKEYEAKKDKLMTTYAIQRIADMFTADFYIDFMMYQMKPEECESSKWSVQFFKSKKSQEEWRKTQSKQLPTTTIWLGVSRLYLSNRKELMEAIYYSCQNRFKRQMPKRTQEEIYNLTVKWYENNFLIAQDDDWELKQYLTNPEYQNNIEKQVKEAANSTFGWDAEKIDEEMPEEKPEEEEIKVIVALPKPTKRFFKPSSDISLYSQQQVIIDRCFSKNEINGLDFQRCSKIECTLWLNGSLLECIVCNAAYHANCWPKNDFCEVCQLMNDSLGFSSSVPAFITAKYSCFPELKSFLKPPTPSLWPNEEKVIIKQIEQNFEKQSYCVINVFHDTFEIYPFYNPGLKRIHPSDQKILDLFERQELAFPTIVKEINPIKGKGLVARMPIKKGQLVGTYSGNVMSLSQIGKYGDKKLESYIFQLIQGPDVKSTFAVYPRDFASAGFFMNHSKKNKNVTASIAIASNGPIVLFQASKKIDYGEELIYNYNGMFDNYNTEEFE